jgi:hypothetical protein
MKKKQRRLADLNPTTRRRLSLGLSRAVRRLDYHLFYAEVIVGCDPDFRTIVVNCPVFSSEVPVEELPRPIVVRYPRALGIEAWQKKYEQTQASEIIETP